LARGVDLIGEPNYCRASTSLSFKKGLPVKAQYVRPFLNNRFSAVVAAASLVLGVTLTSPSTATASTKIAPDKGSITILTWEGYHAQDKIDAYAKKSGVKVNQIIAGSVDEMFAKAQSMKGKIDVAYFDLGSVDRYYKAGLLQSIDSSKVPDAKNISSGLQWKKDLTVKGQLYGLPYNWGTQPLMWLKSAFPTPPTSWKVLWDKKYEGKVSIPDDSYITVPMIALAQGVKNPFNMSTADFAKLKSGLKSLRPQIKTLTAGFNDQANLFSSGDAVVGYAQNIAVVNQLNADGDKYGFGFPTEGTPYWLDCSVFLKGANRKEVYDFVSHTLTKPWQANLISTAGATGVISYEAAAKLVPAKKLAVSEITNLTNPDFFSLLKPFVTPNKMDQRVKFWSEFKAGY
jgi:spermidine/putrescine-binding protein